MTFKTSKLLQNVCREESGLGDAGGLLFGSFSVEAGPWERLDMKGAVPNTTEILLTPDHKKRGGGGPRRSPRVILKERNLCDTDGIGGRRGARTSPWNRGVVLGLPPLSDLSTPNILHSVKTPIKKHNGFSLLLVAGLSLKPGWKETSRTSRSSSLSFSCRAKHVILF